jgi:hypothetical protein
MGSRTCVGLTLTFILRSMGLEVNEWGRYLYADSDGDRRFALRG